MAEAPTTPAAPPPPPPPKTFTEAELRDAVDKALKAAKEALVRAADTKITAAETRIRAEAETKITAATEAKELALKDAETIKQRALDAFKAAETLNAESTRVAAQAETDRDAAKKFAEETAANKRATENAATQAAADKLITQKAAAMVQRHSKKPSKWPLAAALALGLTLGSAGTALLMRAHYAPDAQQISVLQTQVNSQAQTITGLKGQLDTAVKAKKAAEKAKETANKAVENANVALKGANTALKKAGDRSVFEPEQAEQPTGSGPWSWTRTTGSGTALSFSTTETGLTDINLHVNRVGDGQQSAVASPPRLTPEQTEKEARRQDQMEALRRRIMDTNNSLVAKRQNLNESSDPEIKAFRRGQIQSFEIGLEQLQAELTKLEATTP